jgi:hypothetical protein
LVFINISEISATKFAHLSFSLNGYLELVLRILFSFIPVHFRAPQKRAQRSLRFGKKALSAGCFFRHSSERFMRGAVLLKKRSETSMQCEAFLAEHCMLGYFFTW